MNKRFKCPKCGGKETLEQLITMRKNYPFGDKSRPVFSPKIVRYICHANKTDKKTGKTIWQCGYKEKYRLHKGEIDYIGFVTRPISPLHHTESDLS